MTQKQLGPDNAGAYFQDFAVAGREMNESIRSAINEEMGDGARRRPRTWGAKETHEMIGRSVGWLHDNDPDVPRNDANHGRWTLARINTLREKAGTLYRRPPGSSPLIMSASKLKGGVGNSTFCCHFAHYLAMQSLRVLVWDLDPQGTATSVLGALVPDAHLDEEDLPNMALLDDLSLFPGCVRKTYFHNVHLVPANSALQDLDMQLSQQNASGEEFAIPPYERASRALDLVKDNYDVIIIDCPPALGFLTLNALMASTALINPVRPSLLDLASYIMFTGSLQLFYQEVANKPLKYHRVLINMNRGTAGNSREENRIRALYGDSVLISTIRHSEEIANAASMMNTVYGLEKSIGGRETHKRALDYLNAAFSEILTEFKAIWEMEGEEYEQ
ncbi:MAG: cobyrinic acid a,c-diamide synthase [Marinobacter sp. T13-3]|nr:MAG: cobyrinic acid a,c-diamide synthase [Marinobacter sp. T13-3]